MKEIIVTSQAELDALQTDVNAKIIIKFGDTDNRAVVNRRFRYSVEAWGKSSVVARGNSSVVAFGNTQIVDCSTGHNIQVSGNARIVYNPSSSEGYLDYYQIAQSGGKAKLYKAVHKRNGRYFSDYDKSFEYFVGEQAVANRFDTSIRKDCANGIHAAYKEWAVDFGKGWEDLAILEVEVDVQNIIVPLNGSGKVRSDKVLVLREVPLEECGLLGKILARRQGRG